MTSAKVDTTKEEWIAALRSGEFKQGKSRLVSNDGYCCLGVMCEVSTNANQLSIYGSTSKVYDINGMFMETRLGLFKPSWMNGDQQAACIQANDILKWTFSKIADWWEFGGGETELNSVNDAVPYFPSHLHPAKDA